MKIISCLLFGLLCCFSTIYAQKVLTVDLDDIKQKTSDKASGFYYPTLLGRYVQGDTTLNPEELKCIYYGKIFLDNYNPYGTENDKAFFEHYKKERYRKAIPLGMDLLAKDPVNLKMNFKLMVCYYELNMLDSAKLYAWRYQSLLHVIYNSGDGRTLENAMVVTDIGDEYEILSNEGLEMTMQSLIGRTDKMTLRQDNQKGTKIEALYFNAEIPLRRLDDMLKKSLPTLPRRR